jgi:uncharacterized membrane protein
MGAAWTTLICYASMMVISYVGGQKYYYVQYNIKSFVTYVFSALLLYFLSVYIRNQFDVGEKWMLAINSVILLMFLLMAFIFERGKNSYLRMPS